ncbi:MAG: tRNA pseudouridine(38-40) synthase TruA [Ruminococcaceae bacterium]|nr:tRNA pseudouridine(38-40) synthase TruA [Oscillospiraceae bacterium]
MLRSYLICISYDGTDFCGYQIQDNGRTVGGVMLHALQRVFGEVVNVAGCSRTDSGVHALNYFISFKAESNMNPETMVKAVNANLPDDVVVKNCREVPEDFHARYSVISKEYEYRMYTTGVRSPFLRNHALFLRYPLNIDLLNDAASYFVGTHDFRSFMASGSKITDTVRTVYKSEVSAAENGLVTFNIAADGFLYNMVRIAVGTLLEVQQGKIRPEDIKNIIKALDRNKAGFTAPPHGLYLKEVNY